MRPLLSIASILLLFSFVQCEDEEQQQPPEFIPVDQFYQIESINGYYGTFTQFIKRSDGGYFICGGATYESAKPEEMLIFSIGSEHQLLWKKDYQVENYVEPSALSICEIDPSTYMVVAELKSPESSERFVGVMEMDEEGILSAPIHTFPVEQAAIWARIFMDGAGGYFLAYLEDITIPQSSTPDSFLVVKHFNSANEEQWSLKLDDIHWQPDMKVASNGDLLIAGSTYPEWNNIQNRELMSARITSSGQLTYRESFGRPNTFDVGYSIVESTDGGAIVSGYVSHQNTSILVRLDAAGNVQQDLVLNDTMYLYKNEVQKLVTGYLVTNVFRLNQLASTQSISLMKITDDLQKEWSYELEMKPERVVLINSITEADGSVTIAFVENYDLKILTTVPL